MNLEEVVRPFQQTDVFSARNLVPTAARVLPLPAESESEPEKAEATWAGEQSSTWQTTPAPILTGFKTEWKEDASQRETEDIRVENPDDSSQYVDVKRIKKVVFKNPSTGAVLPLTMDWSGDT